MSDVAIDDPKRLRGRVRWSMAARCARMAAYGLQGVEPEPHDERTLGRFARGRDAQRYHARRLDARYGEDDVVREKAVPWPSPPKLPLGDLHTDLFVRSEKLAIEVKSSEHPASLFDSAMTQLAGEVVFDPEAERGALTFLDRDYQETATYPLVPTAEIAGEVEGIADDVQRAARTGALPPRVCARPADGIGRLCPFIAHCFDGWEPPAREDRRDLAELASEFWLVERDLHAVRSDAAALETRLDELKQALLEAELPTGETDTGPVIMRRTNVSASFTFQLSRARKSGLWTSGHDEMFADFVRARKESVRLSSRRVEEIPLAVDYGDDVPF